MSERRPQNMRPSHGRPVPQVAVRPAQHRPILDQLAIHVLTQQAHTDLQTLRIDGDVIHIGGFVVCQTEDVSPHRADESAHVPPLAIEQIADIQPKPSREGFSIGGWIRGGRKWLHKFALFQHLRLRMLQVDFVSPFSGCARHDRVAGTVGKRPVPTVGLYRRGGKRGLLNVAHVLPRRLGAGPVFHEWVAKELLEEMRHPTRQVFVPALRLRLH
mmetsp:Transcript_63793/g.177380  ORF Transcript_63793/g.177380 Transcript_63793/m.177380 type:complete len:215 (-) Transcript_63793:81-725(-)